MVAGALPSSGIIELMSERRLKLKFPKRFLWGAATSAHQIEGGLHNNWTVWEQENAKSLATQAPYQYGDLDNWNAVESAAKSPDNYISGKAINHYELYEQDLDLVRKMNMNAFRLSIEWSRIQPEKGAWDAAAVEHYKAVLAACKQRGIEPIVTLFHFTLPVWFAEIGGFEKRANVKYFVEFAEHILQELGSRVRYIITVNEPCVYVHESYLRGSWPPQVQNRRRMRTVLKNLAAAHNRVADIVHKVNRRYKVSVAKNSAYVYPGDDAVLTVRAAGIMQYLQDDYFLKKVVKRCDFIGVNYYQSARVYGYRVHNPDIEVNDLGWDMQPQYLQQVLERLYDTYHKPVFVTENGVADAGDRYRKHWLAQSIMAMNQAIEHGVDVLGYLHWSLTDNFEWDKGFWPRFGLFDVDYTTFTRTPRPSALWLARFLKQQKEMRDGKR